MTESVNRGAIIATVSTVSGARVRIWTQLLDRHDGTYIVRYRPFASTTDILISVELNGHHIAQSPYHILGKCILIFSFHHIAVSISHSG